MVETVAMPSSGIKKESHFINGIYGIDAKQKSGFCRMAPGNNSVTQVVAYPFYLYFAAYLYTTFCTIITTTGTAINQMVLQKKLYCLFENSGYEGYYNSRRQIVPAFQGGSGVGNNGVVQKRLRHQPGQVQK